MVETQKDPPNQCKAISGSAIAYDKVGIMKTGNKINLTEKHIIALKVLCVRT